ARGPRWLPARPRRRPSARACAWLAVVLLVALATGVGLTRVESDTTTASFLPAGDPAQRALEESARSFGGDPVVILAESAGARELLGAEEIPKLVALEGSLARLPDVAVVYGPGTILNQIAGAAQNLLATISGRRDALRAEAEEQARAAGRSDAEATQAADAAVAEYDLRYGSLLVRGLPAGLPTLRNPSFVNAVVFDQDGSPRQQWRFVVPSPNAAAVLVRPREGLDQAGTERLVAAVRQVAGSAGLRTSRLTVTGMPAIAADLGGQVRREIPLLGGLALGLIAACYLLVPWVRRRHRLLPLTATLGATALTLAALGWLGHPLSLGVVAFLPILVGIGSDFPAYLIRGAEPRRVVVAALASAAGFASLGLSPVPFVRDLGWALAAGVLLAVGLGFLTRRWAAPAAVGHAVSQHEMGQEAGADRPLPAMSRARRAAVLVMLVAVAAAGWSALAFLDIEARPDRLADGVSTLADAQHAEEVLGSAGEVQILVSGTNVITPQALAWMRQVEDTTIRRFGGDLHPIVSLPGLLAFLGDSPTPDQITAGLGQLPRYLATAVVRNDGRQAVISFGVELQDVARQQDLLRNVRAALPRPPEGLTAELVGLPVVAARGYELVSGDRYPASLIGIVAAGLVLLVGLPRRSDAARAVLAAVLATGWGLAGAWVCGVALTPLTVSLGSLATATACEFSVLLGQGYARRSPHLRRSVAVAALAASAGYLALAASGLSLIRQFGIFLAATVGLSLLAAFVVVRLFPVRPAAGPRADSAGGAAP
ncbi:RND transporter, partial [Frankia sp. CiP1_Cm_nod2]|uniref:RND transporter n=1 Tax=Frankia sp. CiP1_Cm_nod2 TaxID=2897161 RepID=UPI0020242C5B